MIRINNLTKIYKSKKRNKCRALDNINLTLPNTGLVFVLGKSGSGKSTLLNLIGGLDNITSGSIIVDGNNISYFNEKEYCDYRNTHIGFIFQDYHLIDELTIYDNICLSLNLRRIEDRGLVRNALKRVDLQNYEDRYPSELSGGERQRVAIARAIVKKPRIILADEPTGNLDTITSTQVMDLLKTLSKECLILIVSHNINDAYKYADRIIELSKGRIIKDESKNPMYMDNVVYHQDTLYYPKDALLSDNDVDVINRNLTNNNMKKIVKLNNKYIPSYSNYLTNEKLDIEHKTLSIFKELKLCFKFLKNKLFSIFLSSFMVSAIMVILALSQTIITFDSNEILKKELNNIGINSIYIEKSSLNDAVEVGTSAYTYLMDLNEKDKEEMKKIDSNNNAYLVYSYTLPIKFEYNFAGIKYNVFNSRLYVNEGLGTIVTDESFFIEKLGKIEYLALSDDIRLGGVYITDYFADSILKYNTFYANKSYEDLLGDYYYSSSISKRGYINGIIKTNYLEKHKELFERNQKEKKPSIYNYYQDEDFLYFTQDVYDYLGFHFSFNKNFKEDSVNEYENHLTYHQQMTINDIELPYSFYNNQIVLDVKDTYKLVDNEIVMNYTKYNQLFNTEYNTKTLNQFVPHKIMVKQFKLSDSNKENPIIVKELFIKKLISSSSTFYCTEDVYKDFLNYSIYEKGYYYNENDKLTSIINYSNNYSFKYNSYIVDGIHTMTEAVDVFIPIFRLIAIVLCVGIIFILVNFATRMINDKMHEIGILKALGTQNKSVGIIFGIQILLIAILTILMSTFGYYYFIDLANDVLIASLRELAASHVVLDLEFLTFKFNVVNMNVVLIVLLSIISLVIPMVKIKNIKPVKIIKTKE